MEIHIYVEPISFKASSKPVGGRLQLFREHQFACLPDHRHAYGGE
jgi:hypothetical protein